PSPGWRCSAPYAWIARGTMWASEPRCEGWANAWAIVRSLLSKNAQEKSPRVLMFVEYAARRRVAPISSVTAVSAVRSTSQRTGAGGFGGWGGHPGVYRVNGGPATTARSPPLFSRSGDRMRRTGGPDHATIPRQDSPVRPRGARQRLGARGFGRRPAEGGRAR